jgi:hypothetical protein
MVSEPKDLPLVRKAAEQFNYPTLTNLIRFGNTKKRFFQAKSIFSLTSILSVPSVVIFIVIGRFLLTGDTRLSCFRASRRNGFPFRALCAENVR